MSSLLSNTRGVRALRVLFVHNRVPLYRVPLFRRLADKFQVRFLFFEETANGTGLEQHTLGLPGGTRLGRMLLPFFVIRAIIQERYQVVVFGGWDSASQLIALTVLFVWARITSTRTVLWTESWNDNSRTMMIRRRLANPLIRALSRGVDAVVVPGRMSQRLLLSFGVNPASIFLAPNASLLTSNQTALADVHLPERGRELRILYFGRVVPYKGLDVLIHAYSNLERLSQDVTLLVAGDGPFLKECKSLAQSLELKRCVFLGSISEAAKPGVFDAADVIVVPSQFHGGVCDAWGMVLNEAMMRGRAIIATDAVGGAYDLIRAGFNGMMVRSGNVDDIFRALQYCLANRTELICWGLNSKAIVAEGFTYDKMVEGFEDAIK